MNTYEDFPKLLEKGLRSTEVVHIVTGASKVDDRDWEAHTLCGQRVPEGSPTSLEDAGDRLCVECRKVYGEPIPA